MKSFVQKNKSVWIQILPAALFTIFLTGYSMVMLVKESMASDGNRFKYYSELFRTQTFWDSFYMTLIVALLSTTLALLIGLIITRTFYRLFPSDHWKLIIWLPMLLPHFVAGYILFLLLSQGGFLSSISYQIGWIQEMGQFPVFVQDPFYIGVILSYLWKEIPFVVLMLLPIYQQMNEKYEETARTLGAKKWEVFKTVELPWIWPVLLETGIIIFVFVLSAYEIPGLLGVTYPKLLPVLAYEWFFTGTWENRPLAQAFMVLITVSTVIITFFLIWSAQRLKSRLMKGVDG